MTLIAKRRVCGKGEKTCPKLVNPFNLIKQTYAIMTMLGNTERFNKYYSSTAVKTVNFSSFQFIYKMNNDEMSQK